MSGKLLLPLFVALALAACAAPTAPPGEKTYKPKLMQHFEGTLFSSTERGAYTVELVCKPFPPVVGKNAADLIIHDYRARDIGGAEVEFVPWMPGEERASPESPAIKDTKIGLYVVENIVLDRPGKWVYRIRISHEGLEDSIVVRLPELE
jgi:hypothetical protein